MKKTMPPATPNLNEKIKIREKIAYTMITMGPAPLLAVLTGFLMIFYTNVVGLNPAAVATLFLISRVMDAVNDPVVGYILDHLPRSKMGKFRHLLIIGSIICSLNFIVVWFGPAMATVGKLAIAYVSYLLIGITYDIMDVAKNSMLAVISDDPQQRNNLSQYASIGTLLGSMLVGMVAPMIIGDGYEATFADYRTLVIVIAVFVVSFCTLGSLGVKERVIPTADEQKYTLKDFAKIISSRPVLALSVFNLTIALGNYINTGLDAYYFTYVIDDMSIMSMMAVMSLVVMIPGVILAKPIAKRIGDKKTVIISYWIMIVGMVIRIVAPTSVACVYIGSSLVRFGTGLYMPALSVLGAENVDYIAKAMHTRSEGALAALSSFVSKLGSSVGGALPGYVLALTGFVSDSATQSASVVNGIIISSLVVPAVFFVIAIVILKFWHVSPSQLDKKAE